MVINYKVSSYGKNVYEVRSFHHLNISKLPKVFFFFDKAVYIFKKYSYNTIIVIYYILETEKYSKDVAGMNFKQVKQSWGKAIVLNIAWWGWDLHGGIF